MFAQLQKRVRTPHVNGSNVTRAFWMDDIWAAKSPSMVVHCQRRFASLSLFERMDGHLEIDAYVQPDSELPVQKTKSTHTKSQQKVFLLTLDIIIKSSRQMHPRSSHSLDQILLVCSLRA